MTVHATDCDCDTYGCVLRRKGIALSNAATPNRPKRRPWRPGNQPSWEKGLAGEKRGGGTFMPYLDKNPDGSMRRVHVKEGGERRHEISDIRARHRAQGIL